MNGLDWACEGYIPATTIQSTTKGATDFVGMSYFRGAQTKYDM